MFVLNGELAQLDRDASLASPLLIISQHPGLLTSTHDNVIKLLEFPIPPLSSSVPLLCHKKSGLRLFLLYFSNLVKWISPKLLTVFLTT